MEYQGTISSQNNVDLSSVIESGQTFLWKKEDGSMFESSSNKSKYITARKETGGLREIRIQQVENGIYWESNLQDTNEYLMDILDMNINYNHIKEKIRNRDKQGILTEAVEEYGGLRVVKEPLFPTIISFICSTQMRIERIHSMVHSMSQNYGTRAKNVNCSAFPTPDQLSVATEEDLKELKLGYRASYVQRTVEKIRRNEKYLNPPESSADARELLMELTGVGTKVADCVLLYSGISRSTVPVDTWIDQAVSQYYPSIQSESRSEMARSFEQMFGDVAGYAQMYLFHYSRKNS
jgi:N-glycosylase/DNA lyase